MPVGYLITVVLLGASTLTALWPLRSRLVVGTVGFLVGMTFTELPVPALLWAVAATLFALAEGDLSTPLGVASAVGMAVVAAGLLVIGWRAVLARDVPERALDDALGSRWRADIAPHLAAGLRTRPPIVRGLLLPLPRRRRDVRRVRDLDYGDGSRRHRLDLLLPRHRPADGPVLVHFHGGRFVSGAKNRESLYLLHRLAARGWTCVSANYRLAPAARFPDYVVDAKRVLAWVRAQGPSYGAGRGPVFVAGNSAGGYLAAFAALTPGRRDLQPGFEDADTSVSGAICQYGYYGRTVPDEPGSTPAAHVHPQAPPFYLLHGDRDTVVPVEWGRDFARTLAATSRQPVVWSELPGAQHSFDFFASLRARLVADRIEAFTAWVRSHQAKVR